MLIRIKDLVLDLIGTLQALPAARALPSHLDHNSRLRADLFGLGSKVGSSDFDIKSAIPLLRRVISSASDAEIWRAVFDLVALIKPTTPVLTVFDKAILDTPLRSSSASQMGDEQIHEELDQRIIEELVGRVFYNVGGFIERYFKEKDWSNKARDICEKAMAQHVERRWSGYPEHSLAKPALQGPFFEWFMKFQDSFLSGVGRRYYTSAHNALRGSEADRQLDIFLAPANVGLLNSKYDWSNVLVIGEHKSNPKEDQYIKTLIQLAGYAREVFGSQPDRRFVPGFTICGSLMRLWVFDRSGAYSSEKFDIHEEPERFITVITGYGFMTDAELGLNTFIKRDGTGKYIIVRDVRISLEDKPIASTKAIVCRGTTCYRGRRSGSTDWEYVVKFAWPSDKRQREGDLLRLAKERGVTGISEWFHHEQITINDNPGNPDTIANLRRFMEFGTPKKLSNKASWVDPGAESSQVSRRGNQRARSKSSMSRLNGLGISPSSTTTSSRRKRKTEDFVNGSRARKRSNSSDGRSGLAKVQTKEHKSDTTELHTIEEVESDSLAGCENETYGNRIHCCLVVSPAGRPLQDYRSVRELLEALRDAIKGHKSLLEDGKILHRDISENNIIITKGDLKGMLIDLDLAKELNSVRSGASHRTGTMQFMAIEVLQGKGHTYRHDLESFFYVFVWMCIRYGHEDAGHLLVKPKPLSTSRLRGWYTGMYSEIANTKRGHIDKNGFEDIITEFSPQFEDQKPLARELRSALFPIQDGAIFTGTFRDNEIMYNGIIKAFNRAIDSLGKEEQMRMGGY